MRVADLLKLELDAEVAKTRSYFEVLPEDKAQWKPHEKSPSLGSLAKHVAMLPGFGVVFLTTDSLDVNAGPPPLPEFASKADLMRTLEETSARLREALVNASDEYLQAPWAFRAGDQVLEEAPRVAMYQLMCIHHTVHHRAQLGTYLRQLGVPLPGLYGPSADGPWQPAWPGPKH